MKALAKRFYFSYEDNKESGHRVFVKERKGPDDKPAYQRNKDPNVFGPPKFGQALRVFPRYIQRLPLDGVGMWWAVVRFDEEKAEDAWGFGVNSDQVNSWGAHLHA